MKHPNIVPVHEIGEYEGRHYFTMDFVEGRSLSQEIREETLPPRQAAKLVQQCADAVHYAHQQGTVHRDLKPANILLAQEMTPKITDFGLAKLLDAVDEESRAELTASGQILGTQSYMSPEQAAGKQELVGPSTDIYSLGAILYACLTGRAPFVADSPVDTLLHVMNQEPVSPRVLNPSVPKDLETICLKCLNKEPHRRYGTAEELSEDLRRFLEGRPVLARPIGKLERTWRWTTRNPVVAALLLLVATLLSVGTVVSSYYAMEADKRADAEAIQRTRADDEANRYRLANIETNRALRNEQYALGDAESERDVANRRLVKLSRALYASQLDEVYDNWKPNDIDASRRLADEAICPPELRDFSWRYLNTLTDWSSTKWNFDSTQLDEAENYPDLYQVPFVGRTRVGVFHSKAGSEFAVIDVPRGESFSAVAYTDDNQYVAAASGEIITIWEARTGRVIQECVQGSEVTCLHFTAAPHRLVSGGNGLSIWDISTGELVRRLGEGTHEITRLSVSSDGTRLLTETKQEMIELWDSDINEPVRTCSGRSTSRNLWERKSSY